MLRPEGVYEIVDANTDKAKKRVGQWVVFPFDINVNQQLNILYTKQRNPEGTGGKWLSTSVVQEIIDNGEDFTVVTRNTEYTFERVL